MNTDKLNNIVIENTIDMQVVKNTIKESILSMRIPWDLNKNQKKTKQIMIQQILLIIAPIIFFSVILAFLFKNNYSILPMYILAISFIIAILIPKLLKYLYTQKHRKLLNKLIDNISSYQDIISIIEQIHNGFDGYSGNCIYDLYDLDNLKRNIADFLWLTDNKIIDTNITLSKEPHGETKGVLLVTLENTNGIIITKTFITKIEFNTHINEIKLFFSMREDPKLVFPYNIHYNPKFCCYCGKPLNTENSHNAEDYELHMETQGQSCCEQCNDLITVTNRCLSKAINSSPELRRNYILDAITNLKGLVNK